MAHKSTFSSGQDGAEYILGTLDDETPTDSEDDLSRHIDPKESIGLMQCPTIADEENSEKFEKNALNRITAIKAEVEKIREEIITSEKEVIERDFKRLEECLIRKTISLDNIESRGIDIIKENRRETIVFVQDCLKLLDCKIKSNNIA
ncbi:uncharacterized protein LOC126738558 [Anthonomus grandis grandis]|uniref:uncharacterized protein LOC126738558 n=1 Tax=Anthonomus grandis grandis TaxID=2921223 RepID=UPI0021663F73|nr:uncharacterized protein LOC126738558 [Anthonomus grandis grandis]